MTNSTAQIKKGFFGLKSNRNEKRRSRKTSLDTLDKKKQEAAEDTES